MERGIVMNSQPHGHILAAEDEHSLLREIDRLLDGANGENAMLVTSDGTSTPLPESLLRTLREASRHLAHDEAISIVTIEKDLTTQQAADLLHVSRPYLIQLLENGDIPFTMVGTHRRIALPHLLDYKRRRDAIRREGLRELTRLSQEWGLYDPPKERT
jgi:excisionase family DNA binding protein